MEGERANAGLISLICTDSPPPDLHLRVAVRVLHLPPKLLHHRHIYIAPNQCNGRRGGTSSTEGRRQPERGRGQRE